MKYQQDNSGCLAYAQGRDHIDVDNFNAVLKRTDGAVRRLKEQFQDKSLPLLQLPSSDADMVTIQGVAARWRQRFRHIVVLGTGGSSLGARAILALRPRDDTGPVISYPDNLDPDTSDVLTPDTADISGTGFIVISKSGSTGETMTQALIALAHMRRHLPQHKFREHFLFIVEPGDSPLRQIGRDFDITMLDHDPNVGGRYSVLSLVGLLPAYLGSLDGRKIRRGAAGVLNAVLTEPESAPAVGAALNIAYLEQREIRQTVMLPYCDRLDLFSCWYRQLWAESIGKDGQGSTPVRALGPVDQHSQLQLYLDGANDRLFTVILPDHIDRGPVVDAGLASKYGMNYLAGRRVGDLVDAMQRATTETLIKHNRPVRIIRIHQPDEETLGALFMHFMLETIIACDLVDVTPFDQPAVEESKVLARQYLAASQPRLTAKAASAGA